MESKETRKLLFFEIEWFTEFSLFFERKTRGSGFWTIKICFVYTGTSATRGAKTLEAA